MAARILIIEDDDASRELVKYLLVIVRQRDLRCRRPTGEPSQPYLLRTNINPPVELILQSEL